MDEISQWDAIEADGFVPQLQIADEVAPVGLLLNDPGGEDPHLPSSWAQVRHGRGYGVTWDPRPLASGDSELVQSLVVTPWTDGFVVVGRSQRPVNERAAVMRRRVLEQWALLAAAVAGAGWLVLGAVRFVRARRRQLGELGAPVT